MADKYAVQDSPSEDVSVPIGSEAAPPSYEATGGDMNAPPSYQSLYGQMKEAKEQNSNPVSFLGALFSLLCNTIIVTIFLAVLLAIPVAMIVIGVMYKDDCPAQYLIPIYLITMGVVYAVKAMLDLWTRKERSKLPPEERKDFQPGTENKVSRFLGLFVFIFFIFGSVWIYGIYAPNTTNPPNLSTVAPSNTSTQNPMMSTGSPAEPYCNPVLYYFAFWVTTTSYIIMALMCCCGCVAICAAAL